MRRSVINGQLSIESLELLIEILRVDDVDTYEKRRLFGQENILEM